MKQNIKRALALAAALALLLGLLSACGNKLEAATMRLRQTEGTVGVSDGDGKRLEPAENLGLYSGYGVDTKAASYAWVDLDEVKLTKMDESSQIEVKKDGKKLTIEVKSGSLFFNVTQPLADDETLDIRTSNMVVGIRGTCGWVDTEQDRVGLLKGAVVCRTEDGAEAALSAGQLAELGADGQFTVTELTPEDVPAFIRDEVEENVLPTPAPAPEETPEPEATEEPDPSEGFIERWHPTQELIYSIDGTLLMRSLYSYDEQGRKSEQYVYDENGELHNYTFYSYNEQGKLIEEHMYDADGELYDHTLYSYDEQGRPIEELTYDADGELTFHVGYSYSEDGKRMRRTFHATGTPEMEVVVVPVEETAEYTKTIYEDPSGDDRVIENVKSYDEHGRLVRKEEYINGQLSVVNECEYDEEGRLTRVTNTESDPLNIDGYTEFRYD